MYTRFDGIANAEHQVPVTEETAFDLATSAKTVTGYALADHEEAGSVSASTMFARTFSTLRAPAIRSVTPICYTKP